MAEVRLSILGSLRLDISNRSFAFVGTPTARLLGYLALYATNGRSVARTTLASKLWPDMSEHQARQALNATIYRLRRLFGGDIAWLEADHTSVRLGDVQVDAALFQAYAASLDPVDWRAALELYTGDLLEALDADWLIIPRVALHDTYLRILAQLCAALTENDQLYEALACAHQWTLADPFNEEARRRTMYLEARLGRHAAALQEYDQFAQLLEEEFQTTPLLETRALADAIRAESSAALGHRAAPPRLIGRRAERARLLDCAELVLRGRGGVVLVEGEPGIGKTQLLESLVESAAWRGIRVASGSATHQALTPFAPLDSAVRGALAGPRAQRVYTTLTSTGARIVDLLLGRTSHNLERSVNAPHDSRHRLAEEQQHTTAVAESYAEILWALAGTQPHLIILDNMHWADMRCWLAIQACAADIDVRPLLLVLSYRTDALRANQQAWAAIRKLDHNLAPLRIELTGLSPDECSDLARAQNVTLDRQAALALWRRTGGNPLFVRELLAICGDQPASNTLSALLEDRLSPLPALARTALDTASILAPEWAHDPWQEITGRDAMQTISLLLERGFVVEQENGYRFRHELLREYLEARLTPERRRDLHQRAAQALSRHSAEPATLAWHYARAEMWDEAARAYRQAGEQAMTVLDYVAARDAVERAIAMMAQVVEVTEAGQELPEQFDALAQLEAHWRALEAPAKPLIVRLARVDVPLGRALADHEHVHVRWTVDAGAPDAILRRDAGKVTLRRHRILRLLDEAQAQGGVPTDADLAAALRVSERTIVADIAALQAMGHIITTRRRK